MSTEDVLSRADNAHRTDLVGDGDDDEDEPPVAQLLAATAEQEEEPQRDESDDDPSAHYFDSRVQAERAFGAVEAAVEMLDPNAALREIDTIIEGASDARSSSSSSRRNRCRSNNDSSRRMCNAGRQRF